jgi:hypothetical protein
MKRVVHSSTVTCPDLTCPDLSWGEWGAVTPEMIVRGTVKGITIGEHKLW